MDDKSNMSSPQSTIQRRLYYQALLNSINSNLSPRSWYTKAKWNDPNSMVLENYTKAINSFTRGNLKIICMTAGESHPHIQVSLKKESTTAMESTNNNFKTANKHSSLSITKDIFRTASIQAWAFRLRTVNCPYRYWLKYTVTKEY